MTPMTIAPRTSSTRQPTPTSIPLLIAPPFWLASGESSASPLLEVADHVDDQVDRSAVHQDRPRADGPAAVQGQRQDGVVGPGLGGPEVQGAGERHRAAAGGELQHADGGGG